RGQRLLLARRPAAARGRSDRWLRRALCARLETSQDDAGTAPRTRWCGPSGCVRGFETLAAQAPQPPVGRAAPPLVDLVGGGGEDGLEVADDAEVDELEDRGLLVLVDRDDRLGGLHAGAVLDRTGDAGGDVELRGDGLAGLADLEAVRDPAG